MLRKFLSLQRFPEGGVNRLYVSDCEDIIGTTFGGAYLAFRVGESYPDEKRKSLLTIRDKKETFIKHKESLLADLENDVHAIDPDIARKIRVCSKALEVGDWEDPQTMERFYVLTKTAFDQLEEIVKKYQAFQTAERLQETASL